MGGNLTDFEFVYMVRQDCDFAFEVMMGNYEALVWKLSLKNYHDQKPMGIQINDLYQEGKIGLLEALYTYQEVKGVGLAHYVQICVESYIRSALRKCRGKAYQLLDSRNSLNIYIAEDKSLILKDMLPCTNLEFDPQYCANMEETKAILAKRLSQLKEDEMQIYQLWNEGYSYGEISEMTCTNKKRIDNVIQKIKRIALEDEPKF